MGFFSRLKAESVGSAAIEACLKEWEQYHLSNPEVEPYIYMVNSWRNNLEKAGRPMLASGGYEVVKLYACFASPLCIRLMAHHMCLVLISDYQKTSSARRMVEPMGPILDLCDSNDASRLNELFRLHNPKSYQILLDETGRRPFETEDMIKAKQVSGIY